MITVFCLGGAAAHVGQHLSEKLSKREISGYRLIQVNTDVGLCRLMKGYFEKTFGLGWEDGESLTKGLGAGARIENGILAWEKAQHNQERIKLCLENADKVILIAGLGGGTGSALLGIFIDLCRERNLKTEVYVTLPAVFESDRRHENARKALERCNAAIGGAHTYTLMDFADKETTPDFMTLLQVVDGVVAEDIINDNESCGKIGV